MEEKKPAQKKTSRKFTDSADLANLFQLLGGGTYLLGEIQFQLLFIGTLAR